jgi:hypothetical protein
MALGGWLYHARRAHALNETDTLLLADFSNTTGEPVFDNTLRQGLAAQLEQSPFLNLVSDRKIQQTLKLMRQPADAQLTPAIARDLCQRVGSKAYLSGAMPCWAANTCWAWKRRRSRDIKPIRRCGKPSLDTRHGGGNSLRRPWRYRRTGT